MHAGGELNADFGNWYVPTVEALGALARASGFARVDVMRGPPPPRTRGRIARRLRLVPSSRPEPRRRQLPRGRQRNRTAIWGANDAGSWVVLVQEVFGGLADLPVAVGQRGSQPRFHLGSVERGEGEHRAAADRGLVVAGGEHDGQGARRPGAERGDGGLA